MLETHRLGVLQQSRMCGRHVRTGACARFSYLGNGWTDCAEIWCVVSDPLARSFANVQDGVYLNVRTCARGDVPLFCISETAGLLALKFGVCLGTH